MWDTRVKQIKSLEKKLVLTMNFLEDTDTSNPLSVSRNSLLKSQQGRKKCSEEPCGCCLGNKISGTV